MLAARLYLVLVSEREAPEVTMSTVILGLDREESN
jgi:hypothetical protein